MTDIYNKIFESLPSLAIEKHNGAWLWNISYDYIKIYPEGYLKLVTTKTRSMNIISWIDKKMEYTEGTYIIQSNKLSFKIETFKNHVLSFSGIIDGNYLVLECTNPEGQVSNYLFELLE